MNPCSKKYGKSVLQLLALAIAIVGVVTFFGPKKHPIPFEQASPYDSATGSHGRKKILILSSHAGGGHVSAAHALSEYLKDDYIIGTSYVFEDVLDQFDPIKTLSNGQQSGEDLYNYIIKQKWILPVNLTYDMVLLMYQINRKKIELVLEKHIQKNKPDLIISVIPIINNMVLNVSKKLNLPFILIPTDLNPTIAIHGIQKPSYDKFHVALSYDDEDILKIINSAQIPEKNISFVGFPVKKSILEPARNRQIRADFNIPANKPVILLLMGAQGSYDLRTFSKQLSKIKNTAHVLIAIGKSEHMRKSLEKIPFPKHISYEIFGFTNRIPELMAIADLLISKSGSVSVNEAIYANLPVLLDATSTILHCEKFNHSFIKKHGFGESITSHRSIQKIVDDFFDNKETLDAYKKKLENFEKPNPQEKIRTLIYNILK